MERVPSSKNMSAGLQALSAHYSAAPGDVLGALFDHAPILALVLDPEGRVVLVSSALSALLQLSDTQWKGRPLTDFMPLSEAPVLDTQVLPTLLRDGRIAGVDLTFRDRLGEGVPARMSAFAELDSDGQPTRFIAILEDLREARAALDALDQQAAEAEEASAAKSRFLAAMSHEIRTPMNAIMGFAQLLEMSELDPEHLAHVRSILSAGKGMMGLLTDLLDLSQVEAGQMRIEAKTFDLDAVLADVESWWHRVAQEKGLVFSLDRSDDVPPFVRSDAGRIQQVLTNYLANAVKFTADGSVTLTVSMTWPGEQGAPGPATMRFRVRDTGPGIAPEHVARLYRPFVRIEGSGGGARTGWGLGLSICANIAEAMGADVGVETEAGKGATFWFDVPVEIPRTGHGAKPSVEPAVEAGPVRKVLLVEDNALNTEVMRRMLEELGHSVVHAANGFEALTILETAEVDAVIMDIMMPGLGGVATVKRLRLAEHGRRDVPVIACSAHVSSDDEVRYRAAGMTLFLPKPIDRAALARAVKDATSA